MTRTIKRALALAGAAAALAGGTAADAQARTYTVKAKAATATVSTAGTFGQDGAFERTAGTVTGSLGSGATVISATSAADLSFTAVQRLYLPEGSLVVKDTGKVTLNADGSLTVAGKGRIVRGAGRYAGAKGRITFTGTRAAGSTLTTFTAKGRFVDDEPELTGSGFRH